MSGFQENWTTLYFFMQLNGKPLCLVCTLSAQTPAEEQLRAEKIRKFMAGLKTQQFIFSHSREVSHTAVKASCLTADKVSSLSKPQSDGEFVKTCMSLVIVLWVFGGFFGPALMRSRCAARGP